MNTFILSKESASYFYRMLGLSTLIHLILIGVGICITLEFVFSFLFVALYAGFVLLRSVYRWIWYIKRFVETFKTTIDEEKIVIYQGVWTRKEQSIPMFRVQHVTVKENVLQRKIGVAHVTVHTAGSSFTIPSIDKDKASEIKELVMAHAKEREEY